MLPFPPVGLPGSGSQASDPSPPLVSGSDHGKSYASRNASPTSSTGTRPSGGSTYDSAAGTAQRHEESREAYTRAQQPKPTYTDQAGTTHPMDPNNTQVKEVRKVVVPDRWSDRGQRQRQVFPPQPPAPAPPPVIVYHDPYSNLFWIWLLSQNLDQQARWAYHHRAAMDQARYRDLQARNAELAARLRQIEAGPPAMLASATGLAVAPLGPTPLDVASILLAGQSSLPGGLAPDPTYTPKGLDHDLMYNDDFVAAAVNPQPATPAASVPAPSVQPVYHLWKALRTMAVIVGILAFLTWLVFFKRWGGTD